MTLLSYAFALLVYTTNVQGVVQEFHELDTQESETDFLESYGASEDPSVLAYVFAIEMKQAEYSFNPFSKLKTFNQSKDKLDLLIETNPENIHLRYIRLVVQENTPSILGYNNNIEEDTLYLINRMKVVDETDYLDFYIHKHTSL